MEKVMSNVFDNVTEANQQAVDAVLNFNRIAMRTQSLMARQQLAALEGCLDAGSKNWKLVTETRDPRELVSRQSELAMELGEKLVAVAQEALEIQAQARDELAAWMEEGMKAIKVPAVPAAAKAAKAAKKAAA